MLHFVPKADLAVAEMRRVARPGATVAAAVWDARGGLVANRILFDTAAALDPRANARRARNFTRPMTRPGELAKAWTTAGFVDVEQTSLTIRMEFASFDDYWRPHTGKEGPTAEYVASLTDPERANFVRLCAWLIWTARTTVPRSYAASAWAVKGRTP
jgi:hypothetical protein